MKSVLKNFSVKNTKNIVLKILVVKNNQKFLKCFYIIKNILHSTSLFRNNIFVRQMSENNITK